MRFPVTLLEAVVALALVGLGVVVGDYLATRRLRPRGLPFDPRCRP